MNTDFKPYPENKPNANQHNVLVILKPDSPLCNMIDKVNGTNYYEVSTWDGKFFIPDPFTGHCSKMSDTVDWGFEVSDQVDAFSEILEE